MKCWTRSSLGLRTQLQKATSKKIFTENYRSRAIIAGAVILTVLALSRLAMTLIGVAKSWTALPFWDMWDGYITWYLTLEPGNVLQWWSQHNEHRILLARIFFYIDLKLFNGSGVFLLVANVAAFLIIITLLLLGLFIVLKERQLLIKHKAVYFYPASLVLIISSSWIQNSNLLWGFQIQFWLGYIFPLAMFLLLARLQNSTYSLKEIRLFQVFAIMCLIGAVFSMSNGIIAAWLAVVFCLILPFTKRFRIFIGVVSITLTALYAVGYSTPGAHTSPLATLITHPLSVCEYFLAYLGGPIQYFTGMTTLAVAAGLGCLILFVVLSISTFKQRTTFSSEFALIAFSWFVVLSALLTAAGRASFGTDQAFASRYQTPVLALWAVLVALSSPYLSRFFLRLPVFSLFSIALGSLLLLPQQILGAEGDNSLRSSRELATIALATDTLDTDVLGTVYYDMGRLVELNQAVKHAGLTVLTSEDFVRLKSDIGMVVPSLKPVNCDGWFDTKSSIPNSKTLRVTGWVVGPELPTYGFSLLRVVDENNSIVGYLSRGTERTDLVSAFGTEWGESGFTGYIFDGALPTSTYIAGEKWKCSLPLHASENVLGATQ